MYNIKTLIKSLFKNTFYTLQIFFQIRNSLFMLLPFHSTFLWIHQNNCHSSSSSVLSHVSLHEMRKHPLNQTQSFLLLTDAFHSTALGFLSWHTEFLSQKPPAIAQQPEEHRVSVPVLMRPQSVRRQNWVTRKVGFTASSQQDWDCLPQVYSRTEALSPKGKKSRRLCSLPTLGGWPDLYNHRKSVHQRAPPLLLCEGALHELFPLPGMPSPPRQLLLTLLTPALPGKPLPVWAMVL